MLTVIPPPLAYKFTFPDALARSFAEIVLAPAVSEIIKVFGLSVLSIEKLFIARETRGSSILIPPVPSLFISACKVMSPLPAFNVVAATVPIEILSP